MLTLHLCNASELPESQGEPFVDIVLKLSQRVVACSRALAQIILFSQKEVREILIN